MVEHLDRLEQVLEVATDRAERTAKEKRTEYPHRVDALTREQEFLERFSERYRKIMAPASLDVEEEAFGTRRGVGSWSTSPQVEAMANATNLKPGDRLLDLGSGAGWPGLRIGELTGAGVVLTDITEEGLAVAAGVHSGTRAVVSDSSMLPFADSSFDAITHSDVLCCLPRKKQALRECHRVLSKSGVMVFTVIATQQGLTDPDLAIIAAAGNEYLVTEKPYPALLEETGFEFEIEDVTEEFGELAGRLQRARTARYDDLVELWGSEEVDQMIERTVFNQEAVARGHLIRQFVVATPR